MKKQSYSPFCQWPPKGYKQEASSRHQQAIRKGETGAKVGLICLAVIMAILVWQSGCFGGSETPSYGSEIKKLK